jgi:hypothetical protein
VIELYGGCCRHNLHVFDFTAANAEVQRHCSRVRGNKVTILPALQQRPYHPHRIAKIVTATSVDGVNNWVGGSSSQEKSVATRRGCRHKRRECRHKKSVSSPAPIPQSHTRHARPRSRPCLDRGWWVSACDLIVYNCSGRLRRVSFQRVGSISYHSTRTAQDHNRGLSNEQIGWGWRWPKMWRWCTWPYMIHVRIRGIAQVEHVGIGGARGYWWNMWGISACLPAQRSVGPPSRT